MNEVAIIKAWLSSPRSTSPDLLQMLDRFYGALVPVNHHHSNGHHYPYHYQVQD